MPHLEGPWAGALALVVKRASGWWDLEFGRSGGFLDKSIFLGGGGTERAFWNLGYNTEKLSFASILDDINLLLSSDFGVSLPSRCLQLLLASKSSDKAIVQWSQASAAKITCCISASGLW